MTAYTSTGGTPATTSLIYRNPLRYRGYIYDSETGFYYLQSRYYDPANHRFINADVYTSTDSTDAISCNMFAYCGNNPVGRSDETGDFWNFIVGAIVGAVVNAVTTAIDSYLTTGSIDWVDVGISAVTGAANGAIAASGVGVLGQAAMTAGVSAASNYIQQTVDVAQGDRVSVNPWEVVGAGATGFVTSIVGSATGKLASGKTMSNGMSMVEKGRGNVLTGMIRECAGQSHSSLIKNGTRLVAEGTKMINTARGISSVIGTLSTWRYSALFAAAT